MKHGMEVTKLLTIFHSEQQPGLGFFNPDNAEQRTNTEKSNFNYHFCKILNTAFYGKIKEKREMV